MSFVSENLVWQKSGRPHVTGYKTFLTRTALIYTISKHVGTSKLITPRDSNFGEVLGYLQKGLSESECTIESDHNMKCAEAEWKKPRSLPIAGFHSNKYFDHFFMYYTRT
jgi:hypothetical protein